MSETRDPKTSPPPRVDLAAAARALDEFLRALGQEQSNNTELIGTGMRVAEAFAYEFCAGEGADFDALLLAHRMPVPSADQNLRASSSSQTRVLLKDLPLVTMCPHHLLPAQGTADVAFEANQHIVGLGAVAALIEHAGRRLILQETLASDVVEVIARVLAPRWVLVRIRLAHACMQLRGERAHGSAVETWTSHGPVPESMHAILAGVAS